MGVNNATNETKYTTKNYIIKNFHGGGGERRYNQWMIWKLALGVSESRFLTFSLYKFI